MWGYLVDRKLKVNLILLCYAECKLVLIQNNAKVSKLTYNTNGIEVISIVLTLLQAE